MILDYKNDADGLPSITVIKEVKCFSLEGIQEAKNQNPIMKEEDATLSTLYNRSVDYT